MQLAGFLNGLAPVAVAGLWQGVALVVAVALCLQCARRMPAAQRFAIWGVGFLATVALPIVPVFFSGASQTTTVARSTSHPWFQLSAHWALAIASLWLIGSLLRAIDLVFHARRLARLWRTATPVAPTPAFASSRTFELCSTRILDRPSVIGFFRPRVLIPDWLLPKLTSAEVDQIVLHEFTHLARRDDWTNLFQKLCLVVFPMNPALWWMDRQLAREREIACDEAVVRATRAPRAYAACLAGLAERGMIRQREALSLGAWHRRPELVNRVHRILRAQRSLSPATARILLGAFGCSLVGVSVELSRSPQLIAFVPTAPLIQSAEIGNNPSAQSGDAVFSTNPRRDGLTPGTRVVQAKAEMPAAPGLTPLTPRPRTETRTVGELRASSEPGRSTRPKHAVGTRQQPASPADTIEQQQFVVFTTWEVETSAAPQGAVADYDTPTDSQKAASNAGENSTAKRDAGTSESTPAQNQVRRRTTFTQLILRVVPSGTQSGTPAAIPIGGSWFVIQL